MKSWLMKTLISINKIKKIKNILIASESNGRQSKSATVFDTTRCRAVWWIQQHAAGRPHPFFFT